MAPRAFVALLVVAAFALGGCDLFDRYFGAPPKAPLPGDRQAILGAESKLEPDSRIADVAVEIPPPVPNAAWPQPGGLPAHAMPHLSVAGIGVAWRVSIGAGASRDGRVTGTPVVADGRVYVLDASTRLTAVDAASGARIWSIDIEAENSRSSGGGGGVAVVGGTVYAATGQAQIVAVDAASGKETWRTTLTAPFRAGPTVANNRVFAISADNQIHALEAPNGRKLWSGAGITESAGLFGTSSPAVEGTSVVATFSSGEIFAMRADNGRAVWNDSLSGLLRTDAISALADVRGLPVIERGVVYAISHGGRMAAIDLRTGARIWEQGVGSLYSPWIAGDFLFVTTVEGEVVALRKRDGRIRWVSALDRYTDPQRKRGRIVWTGPTLVGGRLIVFGSHGQAVTLSPATGAVMERLRMPGGVTLPPAVADQAMYVVTDDGDLVALR
ncbi:MAG: PQQ-binding-like beta-propeller repeat protein [Alphaproteobacteria bacterium]|nr:PQQ-binding-like beta-propeller repeat protein [Alphaproteobacteria bacterium]